MSDRRQQDALARRLGHAFADPTLLQTALTHSSVAAGPRASNERLEFLGDRVLNLLIAEALLERDLSSDEGVIARRLNALVRKEACAKVAEAIGLGEALILGRAEARSGGRRKQALLGDAMEAVIAAVYLDGGFDAARRIVRRFWADMLEDADAVRRDPKTTLQEWAQAQGLPLPDYSDLDREGPDHAPVFTVRVRLGDGQTAEGRAASKQKAQQDAARRLFAAIMGNGE